MGDETYLKDNTWWRYWPFLELKQGETTGFLFALTPNKLYLGDFRQFSQKEFDYLEYQNYQLLMEDGWKVVPQWYAANMYDCDYYCG